MHFTERSGRAAMYLTCRIMVGLLDFDSPSRILNAFMACHPEPVAHYDCLGSRVWNRMLEFWADRAANEAGFRQSLTSLAGAAKEASLAPVPTPRIMIRTCGRPSCPRSQQSGESDSRIDSSSTPLNVGKLFRVSCLAPASESADARVWGRYDHRLRRRKRKLTKPRFPRFFFWDVHLRNRRRPFCAHEKLRVAGPHRRVQSKLSKSRRPRSTPMKSAYTPDNRCWHMAYSALNDLRSAVLPGAFKAFTDRQWHNFLAPEPFVNAPFCLLAPL